MMLSDSDLEPQPSCFERGAKRVNAHIMTTAGANALAPGVFSVLRALERRRGLRQRRPKELRVEYGPRAADQLKYQIMVLTAYRREASRVLVIVPSKAEGERVQTAFCAGAGASVLARCGMPIGKHVRALLAYCCGVQQTPDMLGHVLCSELVIVTTRSCGASARHAIQLTALAPGEFDLVVGDEVGPWLAEHWAALREQFDSALILDLQRQRAAARAPEGLEVRELDSDGGARKRAPDSDNDDD